MKTFKKYLNEDFFPPLLNKQSEEEQIEAVQKLGSYIRHINNPSEKVQRIAMENFPKGIMWIKNPSEEAQLISVGSDIWNVYYIKKPTLKVQQFVFSKAPTIVADGSFNMSKEFQEWLIDKNPSNIFKIPKEKLNPELAEKYKYLLSMNKVGILK